MTSWLKQKSKMKQGDSRNEIILLQVYRFCRDKTRQPLLLVSCEVCGKSQTSNYPRGGFKVIKRGSPLSNKARNNDLFMLKNVILMASRYTRAHLIACLFLKSPPIIIKIIILISTSFICANKNNQIKGPSIKAPSNLMVDIRIFSPQLVPCNSLRIINWYFYFVSQSNHNGTSRTMNYVW